jgi:hypothetical protein
MCKYLITLNYFNNTKQVKSLFNKSIGKELPQRCVLINLYQMTALYLTFLTLYLVISIFFQ